MPNRRKLPLTCAWMMLLACLAGCDNTRSPGAFGTAPPDPPATSAMEFRGQRGCADCAGIEAWLTLEERGGQRHYRLVELYRGVDRERRFEDQGRWQSNGDMLRLQSSAGGERVYLVLPDNRLQANDSRGGPLPAAAEELLVPVGFSTDR